MTHKLSAPLTTANEIRDAAQIALKSGKWLVRTDRDGASLSPDADGFIWEPPGAWTTAVAWKQWLSGCGHGLHGQTRKVSGYNLGGGSRVVFCDYVGKAVNIGDDKVKVGAARILLVNDLSMLRGLAFEGSLSLASCTGLTSLVLPKGLQVGNSLDLYGCKSLTSLVLPKKMKLGGFLSLSGCTASRSWCYHRNYRWEGR